MDIGIGEHLFQIPISGDRTAVLRGELGGIERARGANGGDLGAGSGVDGRDVRSGDPPITDNAYVIFLHAILRIADCAAAGSKKSWMVFWKNMSPRQVDLIREIIFL